jgi:hypothetical protein
LVKTNDVLKEERRANILYRHPRHNGISRAVMDIKVSKDAAHRSLPAHSDAVELRMPFEAILSLPLNEFHFTSPVIISLKRKATVWNTSAASLIEKLSFQFYFLFFSFARIGRNTKCEVAIFNFQTLIEASAKMVRLTISEKLAQPIEVYTLDRNRLFNYQTRSC